VIDLHLHTTASDGRSTPDALVAEAAAAGVETLAVTDHDTLAAVPAVRAAARRSGLTFVPGIEITAVDGGRDIHILGYFVDEENADLAAFLVAQRGSRRDRVLAILRRLGELGLPVDEAPILDVAGAMTGRAVGRPMVAKALVTAGHARDVGDAFDKYLAEGKPAFVPRVGPAPREVIDRVRTAGGVASLAHPAKLNDDDLVGAIVNAGLPAIEVFHPDHDEKATRRYLAIAGAHGLLVTGGSDYHGPGSGRSAALGRIGLPPEHFASLAARPARRSS
jgi:hypothetical protein